MSPEGVKVHQHHGKGDVNCVNKFMFSTRKCCFLFVYKLKDCTQSYLKCLPFTQCKGSHPKVKSFVCEVVTNSASRLQMSTR